MEKNEYEWGGGEEQKEEKNAERERGIQYCKTSSNHHGNQEMRRERNQFHGGFGVH